MQITFLRDDEGFASRAEAWNDLLSYSVTDVPFLRHEYLQAWWATLGGGEWESGELWIAEGRDAQGELSAVAPLFLSTTPEGRKALMFLGSHEITDYLDFIFPTGACESFFDSLIEALVKNGPEDWEVLDLYNIPEASPSLGALDRVAQQQGWKLARQVLDPGGHFVAKVFEGEDLPQLIVDLRREFDRVKPNYPPATRREGREVFLICTGFKATTKDPIVATEDTT